MIGMDGKSMANTTSYKAREVLQRMLAADVKGALRAFCFTRLAVGRRALTMLFLLFHLEELIDLFRQFQEFTTVLLAGSLLAKRNDLR